MKMGYILMMLTVLALAIWKGPVVFVTVLCCFGLSYFLPSHLIKAFHRVVFFKLIILIVITVLATTAFTKSLLPGQPDQNYYIKNATFIAQEIQNNGLLVDYGKVVKVHNKLYSVTLGWLQFLNRKTNNTVGRMFNIFVSLLIVIYGVKLTQLLYEENLLYQKLAVFGLGLLPIINLFSVYILRDVLIALFVLAFFYYMLKENLICQLLILVLIYYLRMELSAVLAVVGFGAFLLPRIKKRTTTRGQVVFGFATLLAICLIGIIFVKNDIARFTTYSNAVQHLPLYVLMLPKSLLGLDFLFVDAAQRTVSRLPLFLLRIFTPDTVILPMMVMWVLIKRNLYIRSRSHGVLISTWWAFVLVYTFGYYATYGSLFVRVLLPVYPLAFVMVMPIIDKIIGKTTTLPKLMPGGLKIETD